MVTRIQIKATGESVEAVNESLSSLAKRLDEIGVNGEGREIVAGERVVQRAILEPEGPTAYEGRLVLYPDVGTVMHPEQSSGQTS